VGQRVRRIFVVVLIGLCLVACKIDVGGCFGSAGCVKGSGSVVSQPRPVEEFTAVRLNGSGDLVVERTGTDSLSVTADDNVAPLITSEIRNGTLTLGVAEGKSVSPTELRYKVTVSELRTLELSGSGSADVTKIDGPTLAVTIAGSGDVKLAGRVDDLKIEVSGSGSCDAAALAAARADVAVSGSGSVIVNAGEKLNARISGSGDIRYLGSPSLTTAIAGSGSIAKR
jgi:hypothetical protein